MTLSTPVELTTPADLDHGLTLVHDMSGAVLHLLHEVSYEHTNGDAEVYLADAGYQVRRTGWMARDGQQYWTASRTFPPSVAAWATSND